MGSGVRYVAMVCCDWQFRGHQSSLEVEGVLDTEECRLINLIVSPMLILVYVLGVGNINNYDTNTNDTTDSTGACESANNGCNGSLNFTPS